VAFATLYNQMMNQSHAVTTDHSEAMEMFSLNLLLADTVFDTHSFVIHAHTYIRTYIHAF